MSVKVKAVSASVVAMSLATGANAQEEPYAEETCDAKGDHIIAARAASVNRVSPGPAISSPSLDARFSSSP